MTLYIHDRLIALSPLAPWADALLRRRQRGKVLTEAEDRRLQAVLGDLRDQQRWLACDCLGAGGDQPLLSLRRVNGSVTIVRHGDVHHDERCPFFRDPPEALDIDRGETAAPLRPVTGSLLLLKERKAISGHSRSPHLESNAPHRASPGTRLPRLGRLLLTFAEHGGLSSLDSGEIDAPAGQPVRAADIDAQYQKLKSVGDRPFSGALKLSDVSCFFMAQVPRHLARFRVLEKEFPDQVRPQGYVFCVADDWESDGAVSSVHLHAQGGERAVSVIGRLSQYGDQRTPGPFLFLGQIGKVASTGRYELVSGALHPVLSKSLLVPVDSEFERSVLRVLLQQIHYWKDRHRVDVGIRKPLFDERVPTGLWVRPDFELNLPSGQRVIVEALGRVKDADYQLRKAALVEALGSAPGVCRVITWDPGADEQVIRRLLTGVVLSS